jgi:hypothetical protein
MSVDSHFHRCYSWMSPSCFQKEILEIQSTCLKLFQCISNHIFLHTYYYNVDNDDHSKILSPFLRSCLVAAKLPQTVTYVKWFVCRAGSSKENDSQFN